MNQLSPTIRNAFSYYFQDFLARVQTLSADLTEAEFWSNPFPYGNSIGHLVLHITGNLNYYIGAGLAASGYVRDRDREFNEEHPPSKQATLQALEAAINTVITTLATQTESDWAAAYVADGVDDVHDRFSIVLRCAVHFHHHIGHISYIKDEFDHRRAAQQAA